MTVFRNCPVCAVEFQTSQSRINAGRGVHCSRACNAKGHLLRKNGTRHGLTGTPTYYTWSMMLQRCLNPKATKYPKYGAVGITVPDKWRSFAGFFEDMGERPDGTTLDRIDGNQSYSKDNCRWATIEVQQGNLRNARSIDFEGESYSLRKLAEKFGISTMTLGYRIDSGWPKEEWGRKVARRRHTNPPRPIAA